jgi:hypothetical protein
MEVTVDEVALKLPPQLRLPASSSWRPHPSLTFGLISRSRWRRRAGSFCRTSWLPTPTVAIPAPVEMPARRYVGSQRGACRGDRKPCAGPRRVGRSWAIAECDRAA